MAAVFARLAALFAMLALVLPMVPGKAGAQQDGWPKPGESFVVGFAQDTMENDWRIAQVRDVERALAAYPVIRFVYTDAQGSTAQQILHIEQMADDGVDVLITSPRDAELMAPVIAEVEARGIPVVLLSRRVEGDAFTTFIHADNREIGRQAARFLAEATGGQARILMLQHIPTTTPAIGRTEGFKEVLAEHPGMRIVATRRADSLRGKAILAVEEVLAEGIQFDAIYAQSDSMAAGARLALEAAGIDPASIPIVGIDYISEAREAIRAGTQAASFTYPTFGREGAEAAVRLLKGETLPKEVVVPSVLVTRDNVDEVEPIF